MPLGSVLGAACLPPLSTPNLLKLASESSDVDKTSHLRSYVRAQEAHMAHYALEGRTILASWSDDAPAIAQLSSIPGTSTQDLELRSGFGTPLLKPRSRVLPPAHVVTEKSKTSCDKQEDSEARGRNDGGNRDQILCRSRGCVVDRSIAEPPEMEQPHKPQKVHVMRSHKERKRHTKSATTKMHGPKENNVDEEYIRRLSERKKRKRKRKEITDPRPVAPSEGFQDSSSDAGDYRKGAGRVSKKGKKGKGHNMPAGLALMHGFSATNVGKNRLTMQLDPAVGVFSKGKASVRTAIKDKPTKSRLKLFSEQHFLSKMQGRQDEERVGSHASSGDNESSIQSEDVPIGKQRRGTPMRVLASLPRPKRLRNPLESSSGERAVVAESRMPGTDHSPMRKHHRPPRPVSPVWDIELEDDKQPSRAGSGASHSEVETKSRDTVVLDVHATKVKWASAIQPSPQELKSELATEGSKLTGGDQRPEEDTSSLAPSNSASQAGAVRDLEHSSHRVSHATTFSKYFALPRSSKPVPEDSDAEPMFGTHGPTAPPVGPSPLKLNHDRLEDTEMHPEELTAMSLVMGMQVAASSVLFGSDIPLDLVSPPVAPIAYVLSRAVSESLLDFSPRPLSPALSAAVALSRSPSPIPPFIGLQKPLDFLVAPLRHREGRHRSRARQITTAICYSPGLTSNVDRRDPTNPQRFGNSRRGVPSATSMDIDMLIKDCNVRPQYLWDSQVLSGYLERPEPEHITGNWTTCEGYDERPGSMQDDPLDVPLGIEYRSGWYDTDQDRRTPPLLPQMESSSHSDNCLDIVEGLYDDPCSPLDGTFCYAERDVFHHHPEAVDIDACPVDTDDIERSGEVWHEELGGSLSEDDANDELNLDDPGHVRFERVVTTTDLLEDLGSEGDEDRSTLGSLQRFSQGRALLMGVSELISDGGGRDGISRMEEDLARNLKGHWQPQRF
ncbi:hypothetical protein C8Q79DRAFT_941858 [Trametes meyenii]|nr:hypothetical protein C8Q79DRAFT_941858 [Trametes meyenii]